MLEEFGLHRNISRDAHNDMRISKRRNGSEDELERGEVDCRIEDLIEEGQRGKKKDGEGSVGREPATREVAWPIPHLFCDKQTSHVARSWRQGRWALTRVAASRWYKDGTEELRRSSRDREFGVKYRHLCISTENWTAAEEGKGMRYIWQMS